MPWRALAVLAILLSLFALAIATVGQRHRLPAPFGPAVTGLIPYSTNGDIFVGDPGTGVSRAVVTGPSYDWEPNFSRDGTRLAFWRGTVLNDSRPHLAVVNADGSGLKDISDAIVGVRWWDWTPDGRILVVAGSFDPGFRIIDPDDPDRVTALAQDFGVDAPVFRPGTNDILFRGSSSAGVGIYVIAADGTNRRTIVEPRQVDLDQANLREPRYSPDGRRIAIQHWDADHGRMAIWITDPDGKVLKDLVPTAPDWFIGWPVWSNDGTRIAAQHTRDTTDGSSPVQPYVIIDVATDARVETGPSLPIDGARIEWAPDDSALLMVPIEATGRQQFLDPHGGPARRPAWDSDSYPNFQRLAP